MVSANKGNERPKTYRERRAQAEEVYQELYAKFRTHKFIDWGILTEIREEESFLQAVPPYSDRFDEYLGYWLSCCTPPDVPALMEKHFPEPDTMDLVYLNDILVELKRISAFGKQVYMTHKGSKLGIGPGVCWCYDDNVERAKQWMQEAKESLDKQPKLKARSHSSVPGVAVWSGLFLLGFTVADLDKLLIKLGLLNESRSHTEDSKPRTWVAIITALRDKKRLSSSDNAALHRALVSEYENGDGRLPSVRAMQRGFNASNSLALHYYQRACAFIDAG